MPRATHSALPPVFIPSKGRPRGKTMKLLSESMVPYIVFVEPQDRDEYLEAGHDLWVLGENDMGISYVCQEILAYARGLGHTWYWLIDDDLTGFFEVVNGRNVKTNPLGALSSSSQYFLTDPTIGQAAIEFRQYAWAAKSVYRENTSCLVVTAIRSGVMADYDQKLALKQDVDFTLQVMQEGYKTIKISRFAFDTGYMGAREGGLQHVYERETAEHDAAQYLEFKWPGIVRTVKKKDGRWDAKVNWRYFAEQKARRASA